MRAKDIAALLIGKNINAATRLLKIGGGSAAPGLWALKISPDLLSYCILSCNKRIVITGTNGKTTTTQLLVEWLKSQGSTVITNNTGSNLARGLVSAFIKYTNIWGRLQNFDYGVFELDEAELTRSFKAIAPDIVVITNLFRDQLDRYGEVDSTKKKWGDVLAKTDKNLKIIYNTADPQLCDLVNKLKNYKNITAIGYFAEIESGNVNYNHFSSVLKPVENAHCPECNQILAFTSQTIVGQGIFNCPYCNFKNNTETIRGSKLDGKYTLYLENKIIEEFTFDADVIMATNITSAITAGYAIKNSHSNWEKLTKSLKTTFGRFEEINLNNAKLLITLVKNPTGFTETLKSVFRNTRYSNAAFILNDNYADGTDVSWIWDVPLEEYLPKNITKIMTGGTRVYDISLRLQYAGVSTNQIMVFKTIPEMLAHVIDTRESTVIFATYTAMLEIQEWLTQNNYKKAYWS